MGSKTLESILFDELASEASNVIFYAHRKATFKKWCFDKDGAPCSSDALARAGFVYSGTRRDPAAATCAFCSKEMIFEANDDPWEEHRSHAKNCSFVELDKLNESDWTVRDFFFLLAGRIAATRRRSFLEAAEDFKNASEEIVQMCTKTMRSSK
ncbi:hypothetical protein KIN20_038107 [Parelaphostrongylus tenuis]|uniref:Uncharacterized protein n=1 Tax=Parelaphostrongylus tenuis TaxID=148309 RepID=A0AAD5RF19_PARTN|nr:hypothetical protein KIN20_038107 [Parelaphostrongylus tenuis]